MKILWNTLFECDNLGKVGMSFGVNDVLGKKRLRTFVLSYRPFGRVFTDDQFVEDCLRHQTSCVLYYGVCFVGVTTFSSFEISSYLFPTLYLLTINWMKSKLISLSLSSRKSSNYCMNSTKTTLFDFYGLSTLCWLFRVETQYPMFPNGTPSK